MTLYDTDKQKGFWGAIVAAAMVFILFVTMVGQPGDHIEIFSFNTPFCPCNYP